MTLERSGIDTKYDGNDAQFFFKSQMIIFLQAIYKLS